MTTWRKGKLTRGRQGLRAGRRVDIAERNRNRTRGTGMLCPLSVSVSSSIVILDQSFARCSPCGKLGEGSMGLLSVFLVAKACISANWKRREGSPNICFQMPKAKNPSLDSVLSLHLAVSLKYPSEWNLSPIRCQRTGIGRSFVLFVNPGTIRFDKRLRQYISCLPTLLCKYSELSMKNGWTNLKLFSCFLFFGRPHPAVLSISGFTLCLCSEDPMRCREFNLVWSPTRLYAYNSPACEEPQRKWIK